MPYNPNELSYNPYNYPSPYQPGQTLPDIDESEMIDIGSLQKFSMVYCNNLPVGSCTNYQIGETLHCKFHSCMAKLTDGTHCPNPSGPGSRFCTTGYHEENGRYPILHSPRSSFSQETDATHGSQPITACNSFESINTAASQPQQRDQHAAQADHSPEQQHQGTSTTHLFPTAYQPQQMNNPAQLQYQYPSQGARVQWTTQQAQSQPTYVYYAPDEGGDIEYQHVAGSAGSDSEWGTIEKRSL